MDWLYLISMLLDAFMIWLSCSEMFEFYHSGNFNIAAVWALGAIFWAFNAYDDGNRARAKKEEKSK